MKLLATAALAAIVFSYDSMREPWFEDGAARPVSVPAAAPVQPPAQSRGTDVAALLAAARGANPVLCALAANSVRNLGWNDWSDAPSSPLMRSGASDARRSVPEAQYRSSALSSADVAQLLESLGSTDACVQEIAVRLLARQRSDEVVNGLVARLSGGTPAVREIAALGLGLGVVRPSRAVDPLIRTLRDSEAGVRANAAWALGRIRDGRALAPILGLIDDGDERVRVAVLTSLGQLDSTRSIAAIGRVAQRDEAPRVRRVAAWALGQLDARDAADALSTLLARDGDPLVREMSAWALGDMHDRSRHAALAAALRNDSDERVRETAAWALAESRDRAGYDALADAVGNDRSIRVRGTAAWALGQSHMRGARVPSGLLALLSHEDDDARLKAAWALGQIGDSSALPAVRTALARETRADVRRALVRAMGKAGGRTAEGLSSLLESRDPAMREAAIRSLTGSNAWGPWPWPWPRPRPFP